MMRTSHVISTEKGRLLQTEGDHLNRPGQFRPPQQVSKLYQSRDATGVVVSAGGRKAGIIMCPDNQSIAKLLPKQSPDVLIGHLVDVECLNAYPGSRLSKLIQDVSGTGIEVFDIAIGARIVLLRENDDVIPQPGPCYMLRRWDIS